MEKVYNLSSLIEAEAKARGCQANHILFGLLFTIFSQIITETYNSAERYMLKVFLDICASSFKMILNMETKI